MMKLTPNIIPTSPEIHHHSGAVRLVDMRVNRHLPSFYGDSSTCYCDICLPEERVGPGFLCDSASAASRL